jgi:capsular polysaccharide biosynthesis protein
MNEHHAELSEDQETTALLTSAFMHIVTEQMKRGQRRLVVNEEASQRLDETLDLIQRRGE